MIDLVKFGERFRRARSACGLTQQTVASELEVTPSTISYWENGHCEPGVGLVARAARLMSVPAGWLVFGEGKDPFAAPAKKRGAA